MEHLPIYISIGFGLTTLLTVWIFYKATHHSIISLSIILVWLTIQGIIGYAEFYTVTDTLPPRFLLLLLPPLLLIIGLFTTQKGRQYIDGLNLKMLTLLHVIRIPVELVLYGLYIHQLIPELMTFEGRNLDILSGIMAPIIFYLAFIKKWIEKKGLIVWNIICLGLLFNIVIHAVLSAPFPFQQLAFEQPNVGILYFPFIWLPCCVVPLVLFSHLASIRQLVRKEKE